MKRRLSAILLVALLVTILAAPVSAYARTKIKILTVTEDRARLRSGPSTAYKVKKSLSKGSKVFYLGSITTSFAHIRTSTGTEGYMYQGYLKSYGTCYLNQVYCSKKSKVAVYKKPSTRASKATRLSKNQHVILYQVKGSWAYIKTLGGTGGYVKVSNLKRPS